MMRLADRPFIRVVLFLCTIFAASWAFAGVTYTVVTSTTQDGETFNMRVRTTAEGSNARIEILEGGPAPFSTGSWVLTRDGGKTFTVVDPEHKSYASLTPASTLNDVDTRIERQTKITNTKPEIVLLSQEPGPPMFGYATAHAQFRTKYVVTFKLVNSFTTHVTREDEVWAAPSLATVSSKDAPALSVGAQMGIDPLSASLEFRQLGFPLKRISTTTSVSVDGTVERIVTNMEVKDIKEGAVDASGFEVPSGFKNVARPGSAD
jgi:hypothetical protein